MLEQESEYKSMGKKLCPNGHRIIFKNLNFEENWI